MNDEGGGSVKYEIGDMKYERGERVFAVGAPIHWGARWVDEVWNRCGCCGLAPDVVPLIFSSIDMRSLPALLLIVFMAFSTGCAQEKPGDGAEPGPGAASGGAVRADYDPDCVLPPPTRINKVVYNTPEWDTLTVALIRCLPDSLLDDAMSHYAAITVDALVTREIKKGGYIDQREALTRVPRGLRMMWTTWWLEAETSNGGLDQYFSNTSGKHAEEAIAGLRLIGAPKTAEITEKAFAIWRAEQNRIERVGDAAYDDAEREHYDNVIDTLTDAFRETSQWKDRTEDIVALRIAYIRAHPLEFVKE